MEHSSSSAHMTFKKRPHALPLALVSSKALASRALMLLLFTVALAALVMNRSQHTNLSAARAAMADTLAPVMQSVASPIQALENAGAWLSETTRLRQENVVLKASQAQLLALQTTLHQMEAENRSLRDLVRAVPSKGMTYLSARIVGDSGSPYVRSALIGAGKEHGVKKDAAVTSGSGLVGRVVEAGDKSARVLLLTDINSRVPVIGEKSRERGMLSGNNSGTLQMDYISANNDLQVGERMLTSGDGGIFPPGIPVAVITSLEGGVEAAPMAEPERLEYISVIDYTF